MTALPPELAGCTPIWRTFSRGDLRAVLQSDQMAFRPVGGAGRRCVTKVTYGHRKALRAARVLSDRSNEDVEAYPCEHCSRWHVGHALAAWAA
jgi:hypothetical protein